MCTKILRGLFQRTQHNQTRRSIQFNGAEVSPTFWWSQSKSAMTGWFCLGVPTEEAAKPISEAISEEAFDPIVSVRTAESWQNGNDNYEFANDVSPDSSVTDQEQFNEDAPVSPSDDILGVFLSLWSHNEEMTGSVPDEIQARFVIPFTVAKNPRIVNEETLLVDKPTLYPIAEDIMTSKITDIQKSVPDKMVAVTRPTDKERNATKATEPPRTPNTEVKPDVNEKTIAPEKVCPYRTKEVEAAMETVATWKASSTSNVKEDGEEAQQFNKEKSLLKSKVKKKCGEKESNPAVGEMKTPTTSKAQLSTTMEPEITETGENTRHKAPTILWLVPSNSFSAVSTFGTMESREDDSCESDVEESRTVEENSLVAGKDQSVTSSKKKVHFVEPQDSIITSPEKRVRFMEPQDEDVGDSHSDLDFDDAKFLFEEADDLSVDSQSGKCLGCACGGVLFYGFRELVQAG